MIRNHIIQRKSAQILLLMCASLLLLSVIKYENKNLSSRISRSSLFRQRIRYTDENHGDNSILTPVQFKEVKLEHCNCVRKIPVRSSPNGHYNQSTTFTENGKELPIEFENTTCSRDAFARGTNQKIVGFSFYGDINTTYAKKKGYFEGIEGNLKLMPKYYPGWIMRVYFDLDPEDPILQDLCQLACKSQILDLCHAGNLPGTPMKDATKVFPMNWRFFPTLDPQVDQFLCRDLDSRFSDREKAAVDDWTKKKKAIHVMRDHPAHGIQMLGASWGTDLRLENARNRWRKTWKKMLRDPITFMERRFKGPDQEILKKYVWFWGKKSSVQHDSYLCDRFPGSIPFPTRRKLEPNNFIASVWIDNDTLDVKCPKKCRPKLHPHWEYC